MQTIPDSLPLPVREGYGFNPVSNIRRTPMGSGRAFQRLMFESVPTLINVSWVFTDKEACTFDGWRKWAIRYAGYFLCPLRTPLGFKPVRARFTDKPVIPEELGIDLWRYSAELEMFELPIVDEAEFVSLLAEMELPVMNAAMRKLLQRWYTKTWPGAPAS